MCPCCGGSSRCLGVLWSVSQVRYYVRYPDGSRSEYVMDANAALELAGRTGGVFKSTVDVFGID